jgi:hypothetical protein
MTPDRFVLARIVPARPLHSLASFALASLLSACGGGSDDTTPVNSDVQTGQFLDSAVEGLSYQTPSQLGTTDATGSFKYKAGETVAFNMYGSPLSSSIAHSTLTPSDTGAEETNLDTIVNQLRFLQTVDTNNNPADGIKLPSITGVFDVDFKQRIEDFERDAKVLQFLTTYASGRALVSVQAAVEHFNNSIQAVSSGTVLDLSGKTASSVIINTACTNDAQAGFTYTFGATQGTAVGSDGFQNDNGVCTVGASQTETVNWADIPAGEFLHGLPSFTYKEINYMIYRSADADGRTTVDMSWHTPGTAKIRYIKRVLVDPNAPGQAAALTTFIETITIN